MDGGTEMTDMTVGKTCKSKVALSYRNIDILQPQGLNILHTRDLRNWKRASAKHTGEWTEEKQQTQRQEGTVEITKKDDYTLTLTQTVSVCF